MRQLEIEIVPHETGTLDQTLIGIIRSTEAELGLGRAARHTNIMLLGIGRVTEQFLLPVGTTLIFVQFEVLEDTEILAEIVNIRLTAQTGILIIGHYKLIGRKDFQLTRKGSGRTERIKGNRCLSGLGCLGRDDHHSVRTPGAIDGRRGGVLQDIDRGNVRRRNVIDAVDRKTIHNVQRRVILCDRSAPAYPDHDLCTGSPIHRRDLYARQPTCDRLRCT